MSTAYKQEHRPIGVETPFGKDVLLLQSFEGHEHMSRLFQYELKMASERDDLTGKQIIGKKVSFRMDMHAGDPRWFNGFVNRFGYAGRDDRLNHYRCTVVPWTWFLTKTTDCRVFQDKTVPEIIEEVLGEYGDVGQFKLDVNGNHPKWEYCVQYRETDINFLSRLMEQEGMFYYFEHSKDDHKLIIGDHKGAYKDCDPSEKEVEFRGNLSAPDMFNHFSKWEHNFEFVSGKFTQTDYDFKKPSTSLLSNANGLAKLDMTTRFEIFDFPGEFEEKSDGGADTRARIEAEEAGHDIVSGEGFCRSFSPGLKFKIKKHFVKAENGKGYVVTGVEHSATVGSTYTTGGTGQAVYSNKFTCIADSVAFRPARQSKKPQVHGVQTAVVTGPPGEEIWPDEYGRVKIQFHWDRYGKKDEKSSCWVRVAQIAAGKQWGAMFIPRIGQEVVVTYLEGDPDRPLITGVVYNGEQMPHYQLPKEKTKSYIKTNTSPGGDGFNEIRFEDLADKEQIFVHAERNMDVRVKHDQMNLIVNDQHTIVGNEDEDDSGNVREKYFGHEHRHVLKDQVEHVEGNLLLTVGHGDGPGGNQDIKVENNRTEKIGGDHDVILDGNRTEKIGGGIAQKIGGDWKAKIGTSLGIQTGQEVHIKAGMKLILDAGMQLTIKAAGGFIDIGPAGVTIQGLMVNINSGGAAGVGSPINPASAATAEQAAPEDPTVADDGKTGHKSANDPAGQPPPPKKSGSPAKTAVSHAKKKAAKAKGAADKAAKAVEQAKAAVDQAKQKVEQAVAAAKQKAQEKFDQAKAAVQSAVEDAVAKAKASPAFQQAQAAVQAAQSAIAQAGPAALAAANDIKSKLEEQAAKADAAVQAAKDKLAEAAEQAEKAKDKIEDLAAQSEEVAEALSDLASQNETLNKAKAAADKAAAAASAAAAEAQQAASQLAGLAGD